MASAPAIRHREVPGGDVGGGPVDQPLRGVAADGGDLAPGSISPKPSIHPYRRAQGLPRVIDSELPADPIVGDGLPGFGPAESAIGLLVPIHIYPLFESVVAARHGHDAPGQRRAMGRLLAPFTEVAAANPYASFPEALSAQEIASPTADNRIVCEPYTKRMTAFLGSDQGAALVVCSLAAARRAGVADRAVFIWSGAETTDVRFPTARPDLGRSPAIAAAGRAVFEAATAASGDGSSIGVDDIEVFDLYSCFPSAVELATDALGIATGDRRALSVTGGLPYFGGPGNNYTTHAIGTVTDILRGSAGGLGLVSGLGWFITKHASGCTEPNLLRRDTGRQILLPHSRSSTIPRGRWRSKWTYPPLPRSSQPPWSVTKTGLPPVRLSSPVSPTAARWRVCG